MHSQKMNRRDWLRLGAAGVAGLSGASLLRSAARSPARAAMREAGVEVPQADGQERGLHRLSDPVPNGYAGEHQLSMSVHGEYTPDGYDPGDILTDFDFGRVSTEGGRTVREWQVVAVDREIEVAPGVCSPRGPTTAAFPDRPSDARRVTSCVSTS
ncbi:MAG: hypothetical protein ACRELC_00190 [Gemmatimonadota bacterium]